MSVETPVVSLEWLPIGAGLPPLLAVATGRPSTGETHLQLYLQCEGAWVPATSPQQLGAAALIATPALQGSCLAFAAGSGLGIVSDRWACKSLLLCMAITRSFMCAAPSVWPPVAPYHALVRIPPLVAALQSGSAALSWSFTIP